MKLTIQTVLLQINLLIAIIDQMSSTFATVPLDVEISSYISKKKKLLITEPPSVAKRAKRCEGTTNTPELLRKFYLEFIGALSLTTVLLIL